MLAFIYSLMYLTVDICMPLNFQNMPIESKLEDEVIRVPIKSPGSPAPPADETPV